MMMMMMLMIVVFGRYETEYIPWNDVGRMSSFLLVAVGRHVVGNSVPTTATSTIIILRFVKTPDASTDWLHHVRGASVALASGKA